MSIEKNIEEMIKRSLAKAPLQPFTEPKEVDCCYIASKEKGCLTCKHRRFKLLGNEVVAYCSFPFCEECKEKNYTYWEPANTAAINQQVKADSGKPRLTLVPRQIIFDVAKIRMFGCAKYPEGGADNWKQVEPERYRDAAFRHFMAYLDDPKGLDEESGLPHLAHLACNIAFLCELERGRKNELASDRGDN